MAKKWIVGAAMAAVLFGGTGCGVEVYEPPNPDPSRSENLQVMQMAWDEMDSETRAGLCAGWMEDDEAALDLMKAGDGFPPRATIREFFDQKCFN